MPAYYLLLVSVFFRAVDVFSFSNKSFSCLYRLHRCVDTFLAPISNQFLYSQTKVSIFSSPRNITSSLCSVCLNKTISLIAPILSLLVVNYQHYFRTAAITTETNDLNELNLRKENPFSFARLHYASLLKLLTPTPGKSVFGSNNEPDLSCLSRTNKSAAYNQHFASQTRTMLLPCTSKSGGSGSPCC